MKQRDEFRVDRFFHGRRIHRVSGARTPAEHRKRDAFLSWLADTGRLDILDAIADARLSINEAYAAHCSGKLAFAATDVTLQRDLWEAVKAWVPTSARAAATRDRYGRAFKSLKQHGKFSALPIRTLELLDWPALRNAWPAGPVSWNRMRGAVSRFLTMTLGDKWHPFRRSVVARIPRADEPTGRVPDLSPELFWRIVARIPEPLRACYVTLVATGMRPGEYVRCAETDLLPHTLSLRVPGTKTAESAATIRLDPIAWKWLRSAVPCPVTQEALARHWKRACLLEGSKQLRLYDLRHAYGQWLSDAGAPEAHIQAGLRHKTPAMTRRYTMQRDVGRNARALAGVLFPEAKSPEKSPARVRGSRRRAS